MIYAKADQRPRELKELCDDQADADDIVNMTQDISHTSDEPIRRGVFLREQRRDDNCNSLAITIDDPASKFEYDDNGFLIRISSLDTTQQIVVPSSLRQRVMHLAHNPVLQGHPGTTRMYDTLRQQFY